MPLHNYQFHILPSICEDEMMAIEV